MSLDELLVMAGRRLDAAGSPSPRRDAEMLLCHVLGVERSWLYTWGDRASDVEVRARFEILVAARAQGRPVAYLLGYREFWGLALETSPTTLIPRPDTETLVTVSLEHGVRSRGRFLDLGCGTGAVALAFASERPQWHVLGVDVVHDAVMLAQRNAVRLGIDNADFRVSDWFASIEEREFDVIAANPPYLSDDDPHLDHGDVRFEPRSALVASAHGLGDLRSLIARAGHHLKRKGWLFLEHGAEQGEVVRGMLLEAGYGDVVTRTDLGGRERVSGGRC
ncbi:peptide chain release factor N(5)-glutamine methyltransferase [Aidingimonas halophila]|uniref:Release factor glutamine methyltransferase n=1 Tax=Aidingimonas halophila TaxID=574349 RepID=A0A1H2R3W4_9GAMM|nr:peptide chain release factor N(5)-glutamine methyltransferase [Aidingimonas halophila]SDW14142.1 [protein release factor]-glutamine N5-methyltransferase [Aidingimonas halophila]